MDLSEEVVQPFAYLDLYQLAAVHKGVDDGSILGSVMSLVTRTTTPLGYSISHKDLPDAFLDEYTEDLPDTFTGMKLPQAASRVSAFSFDCQ